MFCSRAAPRAWTRRPLWPCLITALMAAACGESKRRPGDAGSDAGVASDASLANVPLPRMSLLGLSSTHACALRQAGLYCWGENFVGQLGTGDMQDSERPVRVQGAPDDIVELVLNTARSCVRRSTGQVACWGANDRGQIGDGTRNDAVAPTTALGIDDAVQLSLHDTTTCVLRAGGSVWCWGGSPTWKPEEGSALPRAIEGLSDVVELSNGILGSYCVRGAAGWTRCFKLAEEQWQSPFDVPKLANARALILTGENEVCAIDAQREVVCHNLENDSLHTLPESSNSVALVGSELVACALDAAMTWRCWNILPPMLETTGTFPIAVPSGLSLSELHVGGLRVCGIREDNEVVCAAATDLVPRADVVPDLPR
jgi:Regulator of chromosome condensation (RCC1) repeat